jgi:isocitrate/isopropylmalate dehydrogenase
MGMAPSADVGEGHAVFQPSHGTAPDIAGKGIANPIATILSASMMLEWLGLREASEAIDRAVERVMSDGHMTQDLGGNIGTEEMGDLVVKELRA